MSEIFIYLLITQTAVIGILVMVVGIVLKEYLIEVINNQKKIENELRKTPIEKSL